MMHKTFFATALALALAYTPARAQMLDVNAVRLHDRATLGALTLTNDSDKPIEVEISFAPGYDRANVDGYTAGHIEKEAAEGDPTPLGWVRAFPRRVLLEPGQSQAVRVIAQPPSDLPLGDYFSWLVVSSSEAKDATAEVDANTGIGTVITYKMTRAVPLSFRRGNPTSALSASVSSVDRGEGKISVLFNLQHTGPARWLGRARVSLVSTDGRVIVSAEEGLALWGDRPLRVDLRTTEPVPAGATIRYEFDPKRPDLVGIYATSPAVRGSAPVER